MDGQFEIYEPAPIEYFHGKLMDYFHEWRISQTKDLHLPIDGIKFNNIIAKAKTDTYKKYQKLGIDQFVLKSKL